MSALSGQMINQYGLLPLSRPSADIFPGAIMEEADVVKSSCCLCRPNFEIPILTGVTMLAEKALSEQAGSSHRADGERMRSNKGVNEKPYHKVYHLQDVPEKFDLAVSSSKSSFSSSAKGAIISGVSASLGASIDKSKVLETKITGSYKMAFKDPDH